MGDILVSHGSTEIVGFFYGYDHVNVENPPHTHPRVIEILVLIEGTLLVGFVSSNQDNNRLFSKVLYPRDVFVFSIGMIYFQVNARKTNAIAFVVFEAKTPVCSQSQMRFLDRNF